MSGSQGRGIKRLRETEGGEEDPVFYEVQSDAANFNASQELAVVGCSERSGQYWPSTSGDSPQGMYQISQCADFSSGSANGIRPRSRAGRASSCTRANRCQSRHQRSKRGTLPYCIGMEAEEKRNSEDEQLHVSLICTISMRLPVLYACAAAKELEVSLPSWIFRFTLLSLCLSVFSRSFFLCFTHFYRQFWNLPVWLSRSTLHLCRHSFGVAWWLPSL